MNNREDQKCSIEWENRETITINRIWNTNGDQYDEIYIYIYNVQRMKTHSHTYIHICKRVGNCNLMYVYSLWNHFIMYFKKMGRYILNNLIFMNSRVLRKF